MNDDILMRSYIVPMYDVIKPNQFLDNNDGDYAPAGTGIRIEPCTTSIESSNNDIRKILSNMKDNAIYFPQIKRVTFSVGDKRILDKTGKDTGKTRKVLATTVFFEDGTKSVVQNCENDPVKFNEDGTASVESKEAGIVYAIAKRIFGTLDEKTGIVNGGAFGAKLRKLVKTAYDENVARAKIAEEKALKKEKAKTMKQPVKVEKRKVLEDKIAELTDNVNNLTKIVVALTSEKTSNQTSKLITEGDKENAKKRVSEKISKSSAKKSTTKKTK